MAFAEAEAITVTDELVAISSLREREQEPQKIVIGKGQGTCAIEDSHPPTTVNQEEDLQFDMSLSSEIGKSAEEGSSVASDVFEESPGPKEKNECPSPLGLKLESEKAGNMAEIVVLPLAPAEREANVSTLHSSTEEDLAEPTVSLIEVKSDKRPETQPILSETTTVHPPANDNLSLVAYQYPSQR